MNGVYQGSGPVCVVAWKKGADNGGIWVDFNDARPRALRHGAFPFVPEGSPRISEDDPHAPMVRVPAIGFRAGDWHHVVVSWRNCHNSWRKKSSLKVPKAFTNFHFRQ